MDACTLILVLLACIPIAACWHCIAVMYTMAWLERGQRGHVWRKLFNIGPVPKYHHTNQGRREFD